MQGYARGFLVALFLTMASCGFLGCGGGSGGGGGGGGSSSDFLQLAAEPSYGVMGTVNSLSAFNVMTPSAVSLVGPNDFSSAGAGDVNYLQFAFNTEVLAASVDGNGGTGTAGIVVRNSAGSQISFFMDSTGALDASNAFPSAGVAPATLRLYFQDAATPGVPIALIPDRYSVAILPTNLRSAGGKSFCSVKDSGLCLNDTNCVYHFTLDGLNSPGGTVALASGPTVALPLPQVIQVDDEIRIFFSDHVDFQSIVGVDTTTGRINVTTLDPFCSMPFPINGMVVGANIQVTFTLPAPNVLPTNYGYIVYMPNPFRDPTEVRLRFVDITNLQGIDDPTGSVTGTPTFQNYAIPSAVWKSARLGAAALAAPVDSNFANTTFGQPLELPAKLSLPGSTNLGNNGLNVTLFGSGNAGANDSSALAAAPDGVMGVTDRGAANGPRRALGADVVIDRTMAIGPSLTNNPIGGDLHLLRNGTSLDGIDCAGTTANGSGGGALTGGAFRIPQPLADPNTLESIDDVAFGAYFNLGNSITTPARRNNHVGVLAIKQLSPNDPNVPSPGIPFPPGGTPEAGGAMPPLGQRLYVVDSVRARVRVINSHTFQPVGVLSGVPAARGVGVGGSFLYVSNFDQGTLSQVGINPNQVATFHKVVKTTAVGPGPTEVSVQNGNEDVVVLNSLASSISFVDVPTFTERAQFPVGLGANEIAASARWTGMGTTFAYQAYVTNQFANTVTIYESDTPLITEQNGPNGKILQEFGGFNGPLKGVYNYLLGAFNGIGCQGMLVPNSGASTITYMGMINFGLGVPPGTPGPAGFRTFASVIEYASGSPTGPTDCTIETLTFVVNTAPIIVLGVYPAAGQVAVIDFNTGAYYGGATVPGTEIFGALDQ